MRVAAAIATLVVLVFVCAPGFSAGAEIHVYSSGAPAEAVKEIGTKFSADTGNRLSFTVRQPAIIEGDLAAGDQADLIILPSRAIAVLSKSGTVRAESAVDVARVGIGVVVRAGSARPDISSAAAIRKVLLDARSIVYSDPLSGGGFTGRATARMIDQMGLTDIVRPKLTLASAIGGGVTLVANGKAEIGLFNISEILPIKGVTLVGPLPSEVQNYIIFAAAIPARNTTPGPAAAFIKWLAGPSARPSWEKAGLEPVAAKP